MNMQNKDQPAYYAIIPAHVRYDKELPDKAKLLYGEITALCTKEGYCWATNSYFADLYGVSKETISRLISKLASRSYVSTKMLYKLNPKTGKKEIEQRRIYISTKTPIGEIRNTSENINTSIDENINTSIDKNINTPVDENINTPIDEKHKGINTSASITSINKKNIPSPSVRKSVKPLVEKWFEEFWMAYPRKVGKQEATNAWKRIEPDEALFNTIMQGLESVKHWWIINQTQTKHIPHASTWLNGQRWKDDVSQMPVSEEKENGGKQSASSRRNYKIGGENDPYRSLMQYSTSTSH